MFKKSKIIVGAALLAVSVLSFTLPQQAEAINLGSIAGKAVGAAKEQQEIPTPVAGNNDVSVSFIAEENSAQTRAFFDASATTEV